MSSAVHSQQVNQTNDRELHVPGYVVATYSALLAVTGMQPGDVGLVTGTHQYWWFDGALAGGTWRALTKFLTTSSAISSLLGMQPGDFAFLTDTGQMGWWNGTVWNYIS